MRYSVCKVRVKVWPYFRVLIANNNYIYSLLGILPLTIVGEECHHIRGLLALSVVELQYMGENFCISQHIYLFLPFFNDKSTNDEHFSALRNCLCNKANHNCLSVRIFLIS